MVIKTPVPTFLFAKVATIWLVFKVAESVPKNPVILAPLMFTVATVVPSYTLALAAIPVIVKGAGLMVAENAKRDATE